MHTRDLNPRLSSDTSIDASKSSLHSSCSSCSSTVHVYETCDSLRTPAMGLFFWTTISRVAVGCLNSAHLIPVQHVVPPCNTCTERVGTRKACQKSGVHSFGRLPFCVSARAAKGIDVSISPSHGRLSCAHCLRGTRGRGKRDKQGSALASLQHRLNPSPCLKYSLATR